MVDRVFTSSSSPPPRLSPRLPQPVEINSPSGTTPALDISPHQNTSLHQYDHDVVRELSLPPASNYPSAPPRSNVSIPPQAQFLTGPHNASIDSLHSRPRTPPVPNSQHNLTAHHGLPSYLPPPPRTTFYTQQGQSHPPVPAKDSEPEVSNIASYFDSLLRGSYSQMLSQKEETAVHDSVAEPQGAQTAVELSLDDMLQPDYIEQPSTYDPSFEEYLTSPLMQDDSPEETPFLPTPYEDVWTSPMVDAGDDSFGMDQMPLFGAVVKPGADIKSTESDSLNVLELLQLYPSDQPNLDKMDAVTPALPPLDAAKYTMPQTPSIPPAALYPEPRLPHNPPSSSSSTSSAPSRTTKPLPTGHRRNITPASLVPLDAPTQPRQYVTPSATSRKAVPAAFKGKKRAISEVIVDDEELDGEVNPDAIEAKRRQNTLAARRSRQRKLEHVRELQETVERLTADRNEWMTRAYDAEAKLRTHGIP